MMKICIGITWIWAYSLALLVTVLQSGTHLHSQGLHFLTWMDKGINSFLIGCWWRLSEIMHIMHIKCLLDGDT